MGEPMHEGAHLRHGLSEQEQSDNAAYIRARNELRDLAKTRPLTAEEQADLQKLEDAISYEP